MTSYERRGAGDPIVLVHGLGSRWEVWEPILDRLAEQHDVIAVDLPGFGQASLERGVQPGAVGYAEWLVDLLDELDVKEPHVVGNSMGGGVALELGRRGVASRVTAFAPIGFWHTPGRIWTQGLLSGLRLVARAGAPLLDHLVANPVTRAAVVGSMMRPSHVTAEEATRHARGLIDATGFSSACSSFSTYTLSESDSWGALPDIPVTIAWGTRDIVLTYKTQSARARKLLPFARHVDLPGMGHVPFSDDPELCARIILEDPA